MMFWVGFVEEGNECFQYMTRNIDTMIHENFAPHFDIRYTSYKTRDYIDDIKMNHMGHIQQDLVPWIQQELHSSRLFDSTYWRPRRDSIYHDCMYLGYKKLFTYEQFYFQLAIESGCRCEDCLQLSHPEYPAHFELALYGWSTADTSVTPIDCVEPDHKRVELDNMLPESEWNKT